MTVATRHQSSALPRRTGVDGVWPARGWRGYLVLATLLAPMCVPQGPGQSGLLDILNLPALFFFGLLLLGGRRIKTPMFFAVLIIAIGSVLATFSAPSMSKAALTVTQDFYLFSWFLLVVNVLRGERDLHAMRVAWMWAGVGVSLWALLQVLLDTGSLTGLLGARGLRPHGTMYNSNMLADYLVISLFVAMSLVKDLPRRITIPACGVLLLALIATKSNGGMISLGAGLAVWLVVKSIASRLPLRPVLAVMAVVVGLAGFAWWLNVEWRVGDAQLEAIQRHTFAGRMEHSAESRGRIRESLQRAYSRSPLGIGPGNSEALTVSIAERERRDSYQSKEAHSDYLAYAIERGPLGLSGLLVLTFMGFVHVAGYWKHSAPSGTRAERASLWTASMAAALTSSAVHSTVIEKLHFRHFWLLLAMVCASTYIAKRHAARRLLRLGAAPRPVVAPMGLEPHAPGRRVPALAMAAGAAALSAPRRMALLATPPAHRLGSAAALARRYRTTGTGDPSGGVVS